MDIQAILNRGYMDQNTILDPLAMRPYINQRGESVVAVKTGMKQNAQGQFVPTYTERRVNRNALLRRYDWELIDAEVVDVMRQPLVGLSDLLSMGLTKSLGDIGVSISTYEQSSDMSGANVSMSVEPRRGEDDRQVFTPQSIPVPIISKPFSLDLRTLTASRRGGEGLDVSQARVATIKVRDTIDEMIFNGSTIIVDTFVIQGYTTQTYRDTATATQYGGGDWSAADGNAHKTTVGMIRALQDKGFYGPYGLYVNSTQYAEMLALSGTGNFSDTQLSTILRTIPDLKFVKSSSKLDAGEVVLVQMTKEVVDIAIGMDVTPVSWAEYGGMVNEFRIMAAMTPRVKFTADNTCGVAHATGC